MQTFFESIKIVDGIIYNLDLHISRMNRAIKMYYPNTNLIETLAINIPIQYKKGLVKCKVYYAASITEIEFSFYHRNYPKGFYYVKDDNINYNHKYTNREDLDTHRQMVNDGDEVIIVKHNLLTDSTYSNICLWDGKHWHTPKYPLLKGTKREQLLKENKIEEKVLLTEDIVNYLKISFINAMNDLGEREIVIKKINPTKED